MRNSPRPPGSVEARASVAVIPQIRPVIAPGERYRHIKNETGKETYRLNERGGGDSRIHPCPLLPPVFLAAWRPEPV